MGTHPPPDIYLLKIEERKNGETKVLKLAHTWNIRGMVTPK